MIHNPPNIPAFFLSCPVYYIPYRGFAVFEVYGGRIRLLPAMDAAGMVSTLPRRAVFLNLLTNWLFVSNKQLFSFEPLECVTPLFSLAQTSNLPKTPSWSLWWAKNTKKGTKACFVFDIHIWYTNIYLIWKRKKHIDCSVFKGHVSPSLSVEIPCPLYSK